MHKALKILIVSSIFYNFSMGLIIPIFAIFVQSIGGSILEASRAWFVYTLLIGITVVIFGQIEDRVSKREMFLLGRILFTLGAASYIFVQDIEQLYFVQVILAIALAIIDPAFTALFSRSLIRGRESTEWAIWEGSVYIVMALGAIVGGTIAEVFGFKTLFMVMTVSAFMSAVIASLLMRKNMWKSVAKKFRYPKL